MKCCWWRNGRPSVWHCEGRERKCIAVCLWYSDSLLHSGHYMYRTVGTICTAQWALYVPHSGHYMYRTVGTICTAQWALYLPHSGHYMYCTMGTICTAQWGLYVLHSGHYMYCTVGTICTAHWSLYVLHSGHYMCCTVGTIRTAQLAIYAPHSGDYMYRQFNIQQFYVLPTHCIYVFCVDLRTNSHISLYSINWQVCITDTQTVYPLCVHNSGKSYALK
jgi:hypothetical protein